MPSPPSVQPLVIDPARVAADSMRGYWSQVWRSVLEWLELSDDERLFLEGAEDFDRVGPADAEVVQAKDVEGNVTLRSEDVLESIGHAWEHRQRNRGRKVRFRFLSTGGAGVERGAPFGSGVSGLQLWRDARTSTDKVVRERNARSIADFLIVEGKLPKLVQDFIRGADDEALWTELIVPIEWDLKAVRTTAIIQEVKDRLVTLGGHKGISADRAELVAHHLYAHANETATRQRDRSLTRAELLRLFDEKTRQSLPADLYERLLNALGAHLPTSDGPTTIGAPAPAIGSAPPPPPRYFERASVLDEVASRLGSGGAVVLEGGIGVGKSTIAAGHAARSSQAWGWVDLRGLDPASLLVSLDRVHVTLADAPGIQGLVLDDITIPPDPRPLERRLTQLRSALSARDAKLLVTSGVPWPQRLRQALRLENNGCLQTPAFEQPEIARYLIERGCPAEHANAWAAFIELHTLGHAQLVHARVATLEAQGFPRASLADLPTTPSDVIEARGEARRLISTLEQPARELLYRLSLMVGAFNRQQALGIASLPEAILEAGLVLDTLIGPWLEVVFEGLYRISPLLKSMGEDVNGEAWATEAHRKIGRSLASRRVLSPTDASSILMHATLGRDWSTIAQLSYGLMRADTETWAALSPSLSWFSLVAIGSDRMNIEAEPFTRFMIRLLQFRVTTALGDSAGTLEIIDTVDFELPPDTGETTLLMARYFFLLTMIMHPEAKLPMSRFIDIGFEYLALSDRFAPDLVETSTADFGKLIEGPDGAADKAGVFGFNLTMRIQTRADVAEMWEACNGRNGIQLRRLLWFMGASETTGGLVMDRVWLAERRRPDPDWRACRAVIEQTKVTSGRIGLPGLAHAAARQAVRILAENLRNPDEALQSAEAYASELGWSPGLENEKATVLSGAGRHPEALDIWRRLLPNWSPRDEFDLQITYACRLAAIAAGRIDEWVEAADWLRQARDTADSDQAVYRAGLMMDQGFALWKARDYPGALDRLAAGCIAIDGLPPDTEDRKAFTLRKRAGHAVMWIAAHARGKTPSGSVEPPPAMCSNQDLIEDPELSSTPGAALWLHLAEFEIEANLGNAVFRRCEADLRYSPNALLRMSFGTVRIRQRLNDLFLEDLVEVAAEWAESLELCKNYYGPKGLGGADPLPPDTPPVDRSQLSEELILAVMVNAVFALSARRTVKAEDIRAWRASAVRAGVEAKVTPWLEFTARIMIERSINGALVMRSKGVDWTWVTVATLQVVTSPTVTSVDLMTVHSYWINTFLQVRSSLFVLPDLETLIVRDWLQNAVQGSRLGNPAVTTQALRQACASAFAPWPKIGTILLAAANTIPAPVPAEMITSFIKLQSL